MRIYDKSGLLVGCKVLELDIGFNSGTLKALNTTTEGVLVDVEQASDMGVRGIEVFGAVLDSLTKKNLVLRIGPEYARETANSTRHNESNELRELRARGARRTILK